MKYSFDLDGTLYDVKGIQEIFKTLQHYGHECGILTGHTCRWKDGDLRKLETVYSIKPDFFLCTKNGGTELENAKFKKEMIKKHKIDYHFDDYDHLMREV